MKILMKIASSEDGEHLVEGFFLLFVIIISFFREKSTTCFQSLSSPLKQQMFTMNNKKQPPEVFCKKAVLKNFSILTGKYIGSSLFLIKLWPFRSATF